MCSIKSNFFFVFSGCFKTIGFKLRKLIIFNKICVVVVGLLRRSQAVTPAFYIKFHTKVLIKVKEKLPNCRKDFVSFCVYTCWYGESYLGRMWWFIDVSVFETMLVDTKITPGLRKFYFKIFSAIKFVHEHYFVPLLCFALETFIKISAKYNFLRVKIEHQDNTTGEFLIKLLYNKQFGFVIESNNDISQEFFI